MRKIFLMSLFIVILTHLFATETSNMVVSLPISQGFDGYIDFGFSVDSSGRNNIDEAIFEISSNKGMSDIYAYWDVLSTESFILSLYSEPLNSKTGGALDWVVSWDSEGERVSIGGIDKYGTSNRAALLVREVSIGDSLHDSGSRKLGIWVPANDSLVSGDYSGRLVMQLESIE